MRTTTSSAAVPKASTPTKTNPSNRLRIILISPLLHTPLYPLLSKRFSAPQPGVWGERVGRTGQPSFKHVEGHLAWLKAPCTLEREGALPRTQSRTRPRDREYSPVVARGHHCVRCGGTDRRVPGAFAGTSLRCGPQFHGRPGTGSGVGRFLPAIQAGGRDQDLWLPSGQRAGGVHQCADAGGALGMDSLRERVAAARPGAGETIMM